MGWPKRKASGKSVWKCETCASDSVVARLQELAAAKWLVKHVFYDGTPGQLTIVSMQSAEYAPKPKKAKADA